MFESFLSSETIRSIFRKNAATIVNLFRSAIWLEESCGICKVSFTPLRWSQKLSICYTDIFFVLWNIFISTAIIFCAENGSIGFPQSDSSTICVKAPNYVTSAFTVESYSSVSLQQRKGGMSFYYRRNDIFSKTFPSSSHSLQVIISFRSAARFTSLCI